MTPTLEREVAAAAIYQASVIGKLETWSAEARDEVEAMIEAGTAAPPVCGENHVFPARLAGCGESISSWQEVYRCTHCDIPFHKDCANRHFSDQSITKDQIDSMSDAEVAHAYAVLHGGAM